MKNTNTAKKFAPRFVNDTQVQVTKEFAKNARIFGTPEYKLWREIKQDCPDAEMVLKSIKKNPKNRNSTKNMTYERMDIYIRDQDDAKTLMVEFKKQIAMSQVQTNPYRCVLAWFKKKFSSYDSYKAFFEEEAQKEAMLRDIFAVIDSTADDAEDTAEADLALVSGM